MRAVMVVLLALAGCRGGESAQAQDQRSGTGARQVPHGPSQEEQRFDRDRRPDLVVAALDLHPGDVVADVGAGTGLMTVHLARAVGATGKVVATDIDSAVLDMLGTRIDAASLSDRVERRVVAPDLPGLEPGRYHAILLAQVDNYFSDRVAWLRAALPALRPGGRMVITNRLHHLRPLMAAAEEAGLRLVTESTQVPGQFIAVFTVKPSP